MKFDCRNCKSYMTDAEDIKCGECDRDAHTLWECGKLPDEAEALIEQLVTVLLDEYLIGVPAIVGSALFYNLEDHARKEVERIIKAFRKS